MSPKIRMSFLYIALALLVLMVLFSAMGCRCARYPMKEGFEGEEKDDQKVAEKEITSAQLELFNDLKDNKLSDEEIKKLIDEGFLTNELMEKFLNMLDSGSASASAPMTKTATPTPVPNPTTQPAVPAPPTTTTTGAGDVKEGMVEGFSGSMYASAAF